MYCSQCGNENPNKARYCQKCGQQLKSTPEAQPTRTGSKGLSVASLVLGILSLFPFGPLTGLPAVITGWVALARRRPGTGMAVAGLITGLTSSLVTIGLLFALGIPSFVGFQERARQSSVKNTMHILQTALEAWSIDHFGEYPDKTVSWDILPEDVGIIHYMPGGDPIGVSGDPRPGRYPVNPYSGARYVFGQDLFYLPDELRRGENGILRAYEEGCPFAGRALPEDGLPGTVVILGYTPGKGGAREYAIIGYGRDTAEPLHDIDPLADNESDPFYHIYFVLHN